MLHKHPCQKSDAIKVPGQAATLQPITTWWFQHEPGRRFVWWDGGKLKSWRERSQYRDLILEYLWKIRLLTSCNHVSVLSTPNFQWFLKDSALTAKTWAIPVASWLQEKGSTSGSKPWCKSDSALESLCCWVFLAQQFAFWQGWSVLGSSSAVSPWVLHMGLRDNNALSGVGSKAVKKTSVLALSKLGKRIIFIWNFVLFLFAKQSLEVSLSINMAGEDDGKESVCCWSPFLLGSS